MTKNTQFQSYNSYPASNYNTNTATSTTTTVASWNSYLSAASQIIEDVSSGTLKSTFQSLDGTAVSVNTSGGSLTLSGGTLIGNILSFRTLEATNATAAQKTTITGSISFNLNTYELSGTYTSLLYQGGLTGSTPFSYKFNGEITEAAGTARGSISNLEITSLNSTTTVTTTSSYSLTNALVGWDYINNTFLLSNATMVNAYSSIGKDRVGNVVLQNKYDSFTPVSANAINIFWALMAGDDTINLSGNGARLSPSGFAGNDTFIGDSVTTFLTTELRSL